LIVQGMGLSAEQITTAGKVCAASKDSIQMHVTTSSGTLSFQSLSVNSPDESYKLAM